MWWDGAGDEAATMPRVTLVRWVWEQVRWHGQGHQRRTQRRAKRAGWYG